MQGLWYVFGVFIVSLILYVRFSNRNDEDCAWCGKGITTAQDNYLTRVCALELGVARVYDEWFYCSSACLDSHAKYLLTNKHSGRD
jgi:hypothetical protein